MNQRRDTERPGRVRRVLEPGELPPPTLREACAEIARLRELTLQLQSALDSRVVIEQAKGVLAERLGLGVEEAFWLLRSAARSARIRIHVLAGEVVREAETPPQIAELCRAQRQEPSREQREPSGATRR